MQMFRNLLRFGLLSFIVGCCAGANIPSHVASSPSQDVQQMTRQQRIEAIKDSTVAFVKPFDDIIVPVCTGVWVSKNLILTAEHCVEDELVADYATPSGFFETRVHKAVAVVKKKNLDLALLASIPEDTPEHGIVEISYGNISAGDAVDIMGHPIGYPWTYSTGYVSSDRGIMKGPASTVASILQISAPVWMGNSGGGAFNDKGQLIGICSWVSKAGPHLSFFIHRDTIREFLESSINELP